MTVNFPNGCYAAKGAGDEGFICLARKLRLEVTQFDVNAKASAQRDDVGARDAVEAEDASRCSYDIVLDEKEVCRVAARHEPLWVEHQRLVGSGPNGLQQGRDEIEPAVRIEPHVEHFGW